MDELFCDEWMADALCPSEPFEGAGRPCLREYEDYLEEEYKVSQAGSDAKSNVRAKNVYINLCYMRYLG
jgi:hypothetical protein